MGTCRQCSSWSVTGHNHWARPHLCKLTRHGRWTVRKRFIRDHVFRGRSKPGCRIVGSITIVWLTTEADDQSSLHCVIVSTDVMSDHTGRPDASRGGGCSKTSAYTGQFGWASMIWSILSVVAFVRTEWFLVAWASVFSPRPQSEAHLWLASSCPGGLISFKIVFESGYGFTVSGVFRKTVPDSRCRNRESTSADRESRGSICSRWYWVNS